MSFFLFFDIIRFTKRGYYGIDFRTVYRKNRGLIYQLATKYYHTAYIYGIEFDDLFQVGCLALTEKYLDYDPNKGKISTFAYHVISGAILCYLSKNCTITHIPMNLVYLARKLAQENIQFYKKNLRYMTEEEIISFLKNLYGVSYYRNIKELIDILNQINFYHYNDSAYSLDDPITNYDTSEDFYDLENIKPTVKDLLVADFDMEEEIINRVNLETFLNSLNYLSYREKETFIEILGLRDEIPKTRRFLAENENISFQAIDQRYKKTLQKVREKTKKELI